MCASGAMLNERKYETLTKTRQYLPKKLKLAQGLDWYETNKLRVNCFAKCEERHHDGNGSSLKEDKQVMQNDILKIT